MTREYSVLEGSIKARLEDIQESIKDSLRRLEEGRSLGLLGQLQNTWDLFYMVGQLEQSKISQDPRIERTI